ncbi:MAG TPA: 4-(cytidine 5'-diphospho)-2-C-methyl-D-erythritol kinase [Bryobacteraceae bacterium]|jgi:4-diphosphocytidyl-2-C-methyl-D-erythritol kinase
MPATDTVRRAVVPSLAKINLDLRVLHKRPDGFHELRTIFQTISLADRITIEYTPGAKKTLSIAGNVDIPNNLILRAAEAILKKTKAKGAIRFELDKQIPLGGGLGGGSSNAAAVLLALPVLLGGKPLPLPKLHDLAADLGSDVPFFLYGGTALGLGRGTELYPLSDVLPARGLLVTPPVHVSTPAAFEALNRETGGTAPAIYLNPQEWEACGKNDFESAVYAQHPELRRAASALKRAGASTIRMSGSGSSIFGIFPTPYPHFDKVAEGAAMKLFKGFPSRPLAFVTRRQYQSLWWNCLKRHTLVKVWPPLSRYER